MLAALHHAGRPTVMRAHQSHWLCIWQVQHLQIDSDGARRGTFSVESSRMFLLMELQPALPTCATPLQKDYAVGRARHLNQASPWLVARNAKSARLDPLRLRLAITAVFSTLRGGPGMSRLSTFGDAVTDAKGDYNCCNDQRPANPCFPGGRVCANVKEHPERVQVDKSHNRSDCIPLCADWRSATSSKSPSS
jgi:hypothetical protein